MRLAFETPFAFEAAQNGIDRLRRHHRRLGDSGPGNAWVMADGQQRREMGERQANPCNPHPFVDSLTNGVHEPLQQVAQMLFRAVRERRADGVLLPASFRLDGSGLHGVELYQVTDTMSVT